MKPNAIVDPVTEELVLTREGIKRTTLEYCRSTLANNEPDNEYRQIVEEKLKKYGQYCEG